MEKDDVNKDVAPAYSTFRMVVLIICGEDFLTEAKYVYVINYKEEIRSAVQKFLTALP